MDSWPKHELKHEQQCHDSAGQARNDILRELGRVSATAIKGIARPATIAAVIVAVGPSPK